MTHMPESRDNFYQLPIVSVGRTALRSSNLPKKGDNSFMTVSRGSSRNSSGSYRSKFVEASLSHKLVLLASLVILLLIPASAPAQQPWSGILNPSRAASWQGNAGFTIPAYTVPCATQPSLTAGSGSAAANTASIQNSISSCDSAHNVVNLPSGTYYIAGLDYMKHNNVVVRGAGPKLTYLFDTTPSAGCLGYTGVGFCMGGNALYAQSGNALPGQTDVCSWTGGYSQGSTSLTLNSCGSAPQVGLIIALDQADDGADTGGIWLCSGFDALASPPCIQNGLNANADGRVIGGVQHSEQQLAMVTAVSGNGSGPYTVTISPGVYFNNIRSSQTPGAWWAPQNATLEGLENLTLDHSTDTGSHIGGAMVWCYQCWLRNIRSIDGLENHVDMITSLRPVIRDSYFYGNQHGGSESYCIQMEEVSGGLVENNIMQNTTSPDIKDAVSGSVTAYNFTPFINFGNYMQGLYASHNSGSAYNLLEGNSTTSFLGDDVWGTSDLVTIFRNQATGWQPGYVNQTFPVTMNAGVRAINVIGNVLGQPGYHTQYQSYATSTTAGVHQLLAGVLAGSGNVNQSIFELGWTDTSGLGVCNPNPICDPLVFSTLMRWGNYDVVNNAARFDATESSPAAVPFVNANPTPSSHALPNSFYLAAQPSWWRSMPFPAVGPDVSSGNTGMCTSGTFSGIEATSSSQCAGGTFTASAWGGHANVNPAQDCYLNVMNGPPDGSGGVLSFDANSCYNGAGVAGAPPPPPPPLPPAPPTNLVAVPN